MKHRSRIGIGMALVIAAVGAAVWLAQERGADRTSPLISSNELNPGEVAVLSTSFEMVVPAPEDLDEPGSLVTVRNLLVSRDGSGNWFVMLPWSPYRGCRLVVIDAAASGLPDSAARFEDPCHGGTFGIDGTKLSGPGNRNLTTLPLLVTSDGVTVDLDQLD